MLRKIKMKLRLLLGIRNDTDFYSQGGEDAIASLIFINVLPVKNGFYIDIGSYHPFKHSNSHLLFKAGWRGMNIDPRPGSKELFDRHRKGDINIEAGIGEANGKMSYYMIGENSTMNSFSKENLKQLGLLDNVKRTLDVPVYTLNTILEQHPSVKTIDYLNIDAEGYEMEVLSGIDFAKIPPSVISIEQNNVFSLMDVIESPVAQFLSGKGYIPLAKNVILSQVSTVFYIRKDGCHRGRN
jgi:FkbM family methyltransferase